MAIQNRYEFIYYVACSNCNPNGDPDMEIRPALTRRRCRAISLTALPSAASAIM